MVRIGEQQLEVVVVLDPAVGAAPYRPVGVRWQIQRGDDVREVDAGGAALQDHRRLVAVLGFGGDLPRLAPGAALADLGQRFRAGQSAKVPGGVAVAAAYLQGLQATAAAGDVTEPQVGTATPALVGVA